MATEWTVPHEWTVRCDCGWSAKAPQDELIRKIQEHAHTAHGLDVTPEQARAQCRPVDLAYLLEPTKGPSRGTRVKPE